MDYAVLLILISARSKINFITIYIHVNIFIMINISFIII